MWVSDEQGQVCLSAAGLLLQMPKVALQLLTLIAIHFLSLPLLFLSTVVLSIILGFGRFWFLLVLNPLIFPTALFLRYSWSIFLLSVIYFVITGRVPEAVYLTAALFLGKWLTWPGERLFDNLFRQLNSGQDNLYRAAILIAERNRVSSIGLQTWLCRLPVALPDDTRFASVNDAIKEASSLQEKDPERYSAIILACGRIITIRDAENFVNVMKMPEEEWRKQFDEDIPVAG